MVVADRCIAVLASVIVCSMDKFKGWGKSMLKTAMQQLKSDLKQLPLTLGKLIGAVLAVIGLPWAINVATRRPDPAFADLGPWLALGIAGIVVFVCCSRLAEKRREKRAEPALAAGEKTRVSLLSWILLLSVIAGLILASFVLTR